MSAGLYLLIKLQVIKKLLRDVVQPFSSSLVWFHLAFNISGTAIIAKINGCPIFSGFALQ